MVDNGDFAAKRRGAQVNPTNRFERLDVVADWDHRAGDPDFADPLRIVPTEFFEDDSKSVVTENDSPDIRFRYSVNPYRGCEHGCTYCYARPYHEYLGLNAGLDFETKILVKSKAPALLRAFLRRPSWTAEPIAMSGVTDCYQPVERKLEITRRCLEVMLECRQPVEIITKNRLILRDLDLLTELGSRRLVDVSVAVTTLDSSLAREMEPRTTPPEGRLEAIRALSAKGIPVRALVAPLIPGLTDSEIPAILAACAEAGARSASYVLLRLPGAVRPVFLDWLERIHPLKRAKIESLIRSTRDGRLNDPSFGTRMKGTGDVAEQIHAMFKLFAARAGLNRPMPPLDSSDFQPPPSEDGQLRLF